MNLYGMELGDRERGFDVGLVCENGHGINGKVQSQPEFNSQHCPECGAKTVVKCECGEPIRGGLLGLASRYDPPAHCTRCGKPHVWTVRRAEALKTLIAELDDLSSEETRKLSESVPDLIADTPMTETATLRVKKLLARLKPDMAKFVGSTLKELVVASVVRKLGL